MALLLRHVEQLAHNGGLLEQHFDCWTNYPLFEVLSQRVRVRELSAPNGLFDHVEVGEITHMLEVIHVDRELIKVFLPLS
jgi:hypothetical protein